eukprot:8280378-Alexandrium_andersonii.AAC.1
MDTVFDAGFQVSLAFAPTPQQLSTAFATKKTARAHGPDGIPGSVLRQFAQPLAELLYPLYLKNVLYCVEPVMWGGSAMVPIHKPKENPKTPGSYRGISIGDDTSVTQHSMLRTAPLEHVVSEMPAMQCCGLSGRSTDVAAHTVRSIAHLASRSV